MPNERVTIACAHHVVKNAATSKIHALPVAAARPPAARALTQCRCRVRRRHGSSTQHPA